MLNRIIKVDDFRAMKSWSPMVTFATVNLVYGANGSGKSTLASLFQDFPDPAANVGDVKLEITDVAGNAVIIENVDDYFWPNVRVFNREYVRRNIRFDGSTAPNASALMTLGERQIEADARRGEIKDRLDIIAAEQTPLSRAVETNTRALSNLLTRTASQIGEELQHADPRFSTRTYRSPNVKALLADRSTLEEAQSQDIEADLALIAMQAMEPVIVDAPDPTDLSASLPSLRDLCNATVTSVALPELVNNAEGANWVQAGIDLHETEEACLFCGQSLSETRRHDLARHFDASLVNLQTELLRFKRATTAALENVEAAQGALPVANLLFEPLRDEYATALEELSDDITLFHAYGDALLGCVTEKEQHLFSHMEIPSLPDGSSLSFASVTAVLERHNRQVQELQSTKSAAASRIESSRVLAIAADADGFEAAIATSQTAYDLLVSERDRLLGERAALPTNELNPQPLADSLNSDLAYLIGRDDLSFSVNGANYEIRRSGEAARHLSEGEQTAISLLYFLSSLQGHDVDPARLTVVIDDPVSSLDSNVLVGASSHLWGRLVNTTVCKQLFILTHNFDLFRMWSNQIDRRTRQQIRTRPAAMFEIRMKATALPGGVSHRVPLLSEWPTDANIRKRIRSEYHYLFWRLAHTLEECRANPSVESDIDAAAVLPNVARRLLEGFLAFKYPDMIDNFEGAVTRANQEADPITQQRIVRFLHQFSHNGEGDTGRSVPRPEAITILTSVFDLMKVIDAAHLSAMCLSLDIDELGVVTPAAA